MRRVLSLAIAALLFGGGHAFAASSTFNFEDGTDDGFGLKFSNDASASFPIVSIGGSKRMEIARTGAFQEADRGSQGASDPFLAAMNLAVNHPSVSTISYDWYVDTSLSPGNYGSFLQIGTYINGGSGDYTQDFPGSGKDVELNGTQLASGNVFSGTVTETLTAKYGALAAGFTTPPETFMRVGLILNGDGSAAKVYFDNITVNGVPEPASIALAGLAIPFLGLVVRRRRK
jgi:hypothetical protein